MESDLIFVPTPIERDILLAECPGLANQKLVVCGFGCIAATLIANRTLAECADANRKLNCCLIGIAGRFGQQLSIGEAYYFDRISVYGVGAGCCENHVSPEEMGFSRFWSDGESELGSSIQVDPPADVDPSYSGGEVLTVTSASASARESRLKQKKFPGANAEDMESYGVAAAAIMGGHVFSVIRGISNDVGDRNRANWNIESALRAAGRLYLDITSQRLSEQE